MSLRSKMLVGVVVWAAVLVLVFLAADERTRGLLLTTLRLSASTLLLSLPIGIYLGWLISRTNVWGRRIAAAALTSMLFVPLYLQAAGWDAGFGRQGWLSLSTESAAQPLLSGMRAVVFIHTVAAIPWVSLLMAVALRHADPELEEAAMLDYSALRTLVIVLLPMLLPAVMISALWVFLQTATEISVTDLYQVRTIAEEVYTTVPLLDSSSDSESVAGVDGSPSAVTLPESSGTLLILLLSGAALAVACARTSLVTPVRQSPVLSLGRWRFLATFVLIVSIVLVCGVPLGNFLYNAGVQVRESNGSITRVWSWSKLVSILWQTAGKFAPELGWSAVIGAVTASLCVVLGAVLAWHSRAGRWRTLPALAIFVVGTAIPGPIIGLLVLRFFSSFDNELIAWLFDRTILAPVVAAGIRTLPAAVLVCWIAFQSLASDLLEAASVDGLSSTSQFFWIAIPNRWRYLIAAWIVSFVLATGDLSASILVTPPGLFTLPVRIFGLLHAGVDDQVAGLCLMNWMILFALQMVLMVLCSPFSVAKEIREGAQDKVSGHR